MTDKLTPRKGDRVLVSAGPIPNTDSLDIFPSTTGTVRGVDHDLPQEPFMVELDAEWLSDDRWRFPADRLEVLDRKPAEWPEGWGVDEDGDVWYYSTNTGVGSQWVAVDRPLSEQRATLEKLLQDIPQVLEQWDQLTGGQET